MSPPKTQFKKPSKGLYIENSLWEFARKMSIERGLLHHEKVGSSSEYVRRAFKSWILNEKPYLKKVMKDVDWDEAY